MTAQSGPFLALRDPHTDEVKEIIKKIPVHVNASSHDIITIYLLA